ncbi:hypothetical protein T265_08685 [Opisthorchis viverrini]|uniref:Uncharacterized protein n=1 Tax=Opisthorchis viverrini TaxID=6198 RepID=A0A074ZCR0_OPIVI|nr:hypothetical protein T265_08685 [Opisthorchis viverrini]KER23412.1 hypothetical protein T265_08685 [Opisthorchis viverrini]
MFQLMDYETAANGGMTSAARERQMSSACDSSSDCPFGTTVPIGDVPMSKRLGGRLENTFAHCIHYPVSQKLSQDQFQKPELGNTSEGFSCTIQRFLFSRSTQPMNPEPKGQHTNRYKQKKFSDLSCWHIERSQTPVHLIVSPAEALLPSSEHRATLTSSKTMKEQSNRHHGTTALSFTKRQSAVSRLHRQTPQDTSFVGAVVPYEIHVA